MNELQLVLQGEDLPAVTTHLYLWSDSTVTAAGISRIKRILTFVAGDAQRSDDFHWVGPIAGTDDQTAGEVPVDETQFSGNLGSTDTDVQAALETIDALDVDTLDIAGLPAQTGNFAGADLHAVWNATNGQVEKVTMTATRAFMQEGLDASDVGVAASGFDGNLAATDDTVQKVAQKVDDLVLGTELSDDNPEDVGQTADDGDGLAGSKYNHVHRLPTDNTLAWDGSGQLFVNVTDVIDSLNETVEYYSDDTGNEYDDGGHASMGEDYDTSAHRHIIHKVQIDINGADTSNGFWRASVHAIDDGGEITAVLGRSGTEGIDVDQRHTFVFPNPVSVPASQRIRILGSRVDNDGESGSGTRSAHLSRGNEESASPRESYDDAHLDFARIRHVRVNDAFPQVGDGTHDHDANSVRGDIKIWYTVKIDHGDLVGDGNVNAAHIDSESATDGRCSRLTGVAGRRGKMRRRVAEVAAEGAVTVTGHLLAR